MCKLAYFFSWALIVGHILGTLADYQYNDARAIISALQQTNAYVSEIKAQLNRVEEEQRNINEWLESEITDIQIKFDGQLRGVQIEQESQPVQNSISPGSLHTKLEALKSALYKIQTGLNVLLTEKHPKEKPPKENLPTKEPPTEKPPTEKPPTRSKSRYQMINGKSFYIESRAQKNFTSAEEACRELGGKLGTIENEEDLRAIKRKVKPLRSYWLGINYYEPEGKYVYADSGEPAAFLNWNYQNYRGHSTAWNCIFLHNGTMYESKCDAQKRFICQLNKKM